MSVFIPLSEQNVCKAYKRPFLVVTILSKLLAQTVTVPLPVTVSHTSHNATTTTDLVLLADYVFALNTNLGDINSVERWKGHLNDFVSFSVQH